MLSSSPQTIASPPGPSSSQSSSSGSYYSSSISSSRQPTSSGTLSNHTSPPTFCDKQASHLFSPAISILAHPHHELDPSRIPYPSRSLSSRSPMDSSAHNQSTVHQQSLSASKLSPSSAMPQPMLRYATTSMVDNWLTNPSQVIPIESSLHYNTNPSSTTHPSSHVVLASPEDASCAPAAKARRTSPGGSRASDDLRLPRDHSASPTASEPLLRSHSQPKGILRFQSSSNPTSLDSRPSERSQSTRTQALSHSHHQQQQYQDSPLRFESSSHFQHAPSSKYDAATSASGISPRDRTSDSTAAKNPASQANHRTAASTSCSPIGNSASVSGSIKTHDAPTSTPARLPKMNLATFPPQDLLKVLAALLQEIATTNDEFRPGGGKDDANRRKKSGRTHTKDKTGSHNLAQTTADSLPSAPQDGSSLSPTRPHPHTLGSHLSFNDTRRPSVTTAALGALATPSSTLCFHARNVPSISIESYLLRILKYCPTTNEVFLSLLVYFDRMSRMGTGAKPGQNGDGEAAGEAAGLPRAAERVGGMSNSNASLKDHHEQSTTESEEGFAHPGIRGFAIDSYNVHRLVIAGVTVASKFFSDVFYTNSRYAKVGGLPVHELNQLELQFLLLNDFRLTISLQEMQRYADQLLMYGGGRTEPVSMVKELTMPPTQSSTEDGASSSSVPSPRRKEGNREFRSVSAFHTADVSSGAAQTSLAAVADPSAPPIPYNTRDVHMQDG